MTPPDIAVCTGKDVEDWARMREALWPGEHGLADHARRMLSEPHLRNLIARNSMSAAIGFAEASIRWDYVNGCETSPVVFLEGLYVVPTARRQGVAQALVAVIEDWARSLGMAEFASDALLDNPDSHRMHAALGFSEMEHVVYFRKALKR